MESFLIKAAQLILSLSILVLVHEFGHFLFARIFKVRVEKFYLFFDAWFALFRFKPKNSETEYGIGWLPLGGYCKISGMIDESMDKEQMAQPPKPYEFRSKPAGQRLLIMVGGVLFNFLLALFIYSMILLKWGDTYLPLENVTMGLEYSETFRNVGFQDGDIPLEADGEKLQRLDESTTRKILNAQQVIVLRNGAKTTLTLPDDMMQRLMRDKQGFAGYRYPMIVDGFPSDNSPAKKAGLLPGDRIISVDSVSTPTYYNVRAYLSENPDKQVMLGVERNGQHLTITTLNNEEGMLQVHAKNIYQIYPSEKVTYSFLGSFPAGAKLGVNTLKGYVSDMKYVFTKEGASNVGGFGTIGNLFPAVWNWRAFWMMTAFLSIILAFMNILPIPALDGGHVMFLLYEVIARRKPSEKFLEYAQITGMFLLLGLLIFANGNDLIRFLFK